MNCRRLYDELNIFKNIGQSRIFIAIWLLIVCLQVLIASFGGRSFNIEFMVDWLSSQGMSLQGWAVSLALGLTSLPVSCLIRLVKEEDCFYLCTKKRASLRSAAQVASPSQEEDSSRLKFYSER